MEDIRFYDDKGNRLLLTYTYIRLEWAEYYQACGTVRVVFPLNHAVVKLLAEHKHLIMEWNGKQAVTVKLQTDAYEAIVSAKPLLNLLARRVVPQERLMLRGTAEACVRTLLTQYAGFLEVWQSTDQTAEKTVWIEKGDLLTAVRACLADTAVGMDISFADGKFIFSFLYGQANERRISENNRNMTEIVCSTDYTAIQTACYFTEAFSDTVKIDSGAADRLRDGVSKNYMKQYVTTEAVCISEKYYVANTYIYCDTTDGVFQSASEEQQSRLRYKALTQNPLAVFEADLRDFTREEAENLLAGRQHEKERWQFKPQNIRLRLGDIVGVEKTSGQENGLYFMQVRGLKWDSAQESAEAELVPFVR